MFNKRFQSCRFLVWCLFVSAGVALISGCGGGSSQSTTSHGASGDRNSARTASGDLVIISPHGREIQVEFERVFKQKHPDVRLRWLSQGGSSDDLRFVQSQFAGKKADQGIGVDVYFGGGAESFLELEEDGLLQPLPSNYGVPAVLNGVPLRGKNNTWVAAALSGFGILYNKTIAARDNLPVPAVWADLGNPQLRNRIALADPRHSGSAHMAYEIILQANGWKRGWEVLTAMAGNARTFSNSSSQLLDDVSNGEAVMAPAIDFYATTRIARAGADKLGYVEPRGQRVVTADPIGILRGAAHREMARDFVALVMSPEGQKLWMHKKGSPGGPQGNELYRLAANPAMFKPLAAESLIRTNPYEGRNEFRFNPQKSSTRRRALDDLLGAVLIDNHDPLKARWEKTPDPSKIAFVPVSEAELTKLAAKWDDATFRNAKISEWSQAARKHFSS